MNGGGQGRAKVLSTLSRLGALSRADLSRRTGLAPSTVSSIVAELVGSGLVVEVPGSGESTIRRGRPATLVALHRRAGVVVGIDVGKRHVRVAVADLAHRVLGETTVALDSDVTAADGIDEVVRLVDQLLPRAGADRSDVVGVGMGLPGPVRADTGELGDSTILPGWVGVRAPEAMTRALGMPVLVDNDANLGALSEATWGAARGCAEVVYVKVATGIGAGLIIGGQPFRGIGGTAGEIGHLVIDPAGPTCRCGNRGCLETLAGADSILSALRPTHGDRLLLKDALDRAAEGDSGCRRAIADAAGAIGTALGTLCNVLNPQRIVVGGELGTAGELVLGPLRESLRRAAIHSAADDVDDVQGALGDRAEVLGAIALALRGAQRLA